MPTPVRYPNGVNNCTPIEPLYMYPEPDRTKLIQYFDDFHLYTAAQWTVTETDAAATQAVDTGANGGILKLTMDGAGTATAVNQIQLINETFKYVSTKKFWLKARFSATATLANFGIAVGLMITDTTAVAGVTDGIFFRKPTGSSTLSAVLCKNSTETTIAIGAMVSGTMVDVALYYDPRGFVEVFLNGAKVGSTTTLTNIVDDEELAVTIASLNATAAAANVLAVDYILAATER